MNTQNQVDDDLNSFDMQRRFLAYNKSANIYQYIKIILVKNLDGKSDYEDIDGYFRAPTRNSVQYLLLDNFISTIERS
jgi:hypothetical protein